MTIPEWPSRFDEGVSPQRGALDAGGLRLSYLEWGPPEGKPLLLLHGITSSARTWWRVAPRLVARGYHVVALDMPGHGQSDETDDHTLDAIASRVGHAFNLPGFEGAALVGHSWGGATALAVAAGAAGGPTPSRVALLDPPLQLSPEGGAQALPRFMVGIGDAFEASLARLRASEPRWNEGDYHAKAEALAQIREAAVRGFLTESGTWDFLPRLGQVAAPLLLVVADPRYSVIPEALIERAQAALRPGLGQLVVIPGAQHNMFRSEFEPFLQVLLPWLESPALL